jgi:hypothetical protein
MRVKQGDLGLLQHPAAVELLGSTIPARLAYVPVPVLWSSYSYF